MSTIVLTGGGTAGHVTPNMALVPLLKNDGHDIHYIGAYMGVEKELTASLPFTFHGISSGKLRRYFDIKNISDPFKVIWGIFQSFMILSKLKPSVVFSKGGFVSVPVVVAAKLKGIPVVIHESDLTPGLANKISIPMAKVLCTTFEETAKAVGDKAIYTD